MSRLAVVGAGYVRLVTSATLACQGHDVCCGFRYQGIGRP